MAAYIALLFKALYNVPAAHSPIHTMMLASCHAGCWHNHREQFVVTQGHFDMWTGGIGDRTTSLLISGQPALPPLKTLKTPRAASPFYKNITNFIDYHNSSTVVIDCKTGNQIHKYSYIKCV